RAERSDARPARASEKRTGIAPALSRESGASRAVPGRDYSQSTACLRVVSRSVSEHGSGVSVRDRFTTYALPVTPYLHRCAAAALVGSRCSRELHAFGRLIGCDLRGSVEHGTKSARRNRAIASARFGDERSAARFFGLPR